MDAVWTQRFLVEGLAIDPEEVATKIQALIPGSRARRVGDEIEIKTPGPRASASLARVKPKRAALELLWQVGNYTDRVVIAFGDVLGLEKALDDIALAFRGASYVKFVEGRRVKSISGCK